MGSTDEQADTYLLWRLQIPSKYSAVAYLSSEFVLGGAVPRYLIFDKATYGPEGIEDVESSFYVQFFPEVDGTSEHIGDVNKLMEGIRMAESHWASQGI